MRNWLVAAFALMAGLVVVSCYRPEPSDGAFTCSVDFGGLCPGGFVCSPQGLCIQTTGHDMGGAPLDLAGDQASPPVVRSCDDKIAAGAFSNLTALTALNTSADEEHLALDPSMTAPRLFFVRSNQVYAAPISATDRKMVSTPQAVTVTSGPTTVTGLNFTNDGVLWLSGTTGGMTGMYGATATNATTYTAPAPRAPIAANCAFSDAFFMQGDSTFQMYAAFPLSGCAGPSYVVRGALDRNAGAFYSALGQAGWAAPTMTASGLLLIVSSTGSDRHLWTAARSDLPYQFVTANQIDMSSIGAGIEDRQALVNADCTTIYFSSVRSGGAGGADLYAADIAAE
jgi:hypothetical protein